MLKEGTKAPAFQAQDQYGETHTLADHAGAWVMLYFYPKDNTPGCTKEACAIRDAWSDFHDASITVFGVSADSVKKHKNFAEKFGLPFPLLSDSDKKIIKDYEALGMKKIFGHTYEGIFRITYLIAPDGTIAKTYPKVAPDTHAQEIIKDIAELQKKLS
jgi:peroxiredoxin Q/BCP